MACLKIPNINYIIVSGRLTRDPELRYTPKGTPVASFSIAVSRYTKNKDSGEIKEEASFFNIIAWDNLADRCADRLSKGSAVVVEGYLRSRKYETQAGDTRYIVEIVSRRVQFLDKQETQEEVSENPDLI